MISWGFVIVSSQLLSCPLPLFPDGVGLVVAVQDRKVMTLIEVRWYYDTGIISFRFKIMAEYWSMLNSGLLWLIYITPAVRGVVGDLKGEFI